jgi:hypothetical protein
MRCLLMTLLPEANRPSLWRRWTADSFTAHQLVLNIDLVLIIPSQLLNDMTVVHRMTKYNNIK